MVRRRFLAVVLAAMAAIVIAQPGASSRGQEGGMLNVSIFSVPRGFDYVDPALSFSPAGWSLLDATCARLYTYPDKASPGSFRPRPEVAADYSVSKDMKTYTFTLRRGFRFSNRGEPVRASAFAHAIDRVLDPDVQSLGASFMRDIVGADDVLAGRTERARGVRTPNPYTLVVSFKRPAPDFLGRTTLPFFCAVPPWLPASAEGIGKVPSAGPYYVVEYRATEGIVIRRNRFYGGKRKVHLEGFNVNLRGGTPVELLESIERGDADWGWMPAGVFYRVPGLDFEAKYGRRYTVRPGLTVRMFLFNTSRPPFRNNLRLRRAVNFLLDRGALAASTYGSPALTPTDQYIPPGVPGFRDANVYPLRGNLDRARDLARGQLPGTKAVVLVQNVPLEVEGAQRLKEQLRSIGLDVEIRPQSGHAATTAFLAGLTRPGAARQADWDMVYVLWTPNIPDPHEYLSLLLRAHVQGGEAQTRARAKLASAALARAARLPQGRARNLAYAEVDAVIARDIAPGAVMSVLNEATFVSEHVDCQVLRPGLDLAVACLRE
jgi:peptide/nickel transport system substrate-binding protein